MKDCCEVSCVLDRTLSNAKGFSQKPEAPWAMTLASDREKSKDESIVIPIET